MQTLTQLTLKDLEPGDIFVHARCKTKQPQRYIVYGNPMFDIRHGSPTRKCRKITGEYASKSCRLEVIKVGESKHKDKIMEMFTPKSKVCNSQP